MFGHYSILRDLVFTSQHSRVKISSLRSPKRISVQDSLVIKPCRRPNRPLMTERCCSDLPLGRGARAHSTVHTSYLRSSISTGVWTRWWIAVFLADTRLSSRSTIEPTTAVPDDVGARLSGALRAVAASLPSPVARSG